MRNEECLPGGRLELEHALGGADGLAVILGEHGDLEEGRHVPVVLQAVQAPFLACEESDKEVSKGCVNVHFL